MTSANLALVMAPDLLCVTVMDDYGGFRRAEVRASDHARATTEVTGRIFGPLPPFFFFKILLHVDNFY